MIVQRLIGPGSKLSATRRFAQTTLGDELSLGEVKEAELLAALDWLLERQPRIERTLAPRHLPGDQDGNAFVLYDLSSSYMEGRCCPLATLGYSRDGVKGKLQVNYGLICSPEGRPVGVRVHEGATTDSQTVPDTVAAVRERFGIEQVVFVGDRGMITQAHAATFKEQGVDFISALKSVQIRSLVNSGDLQLSLFDQVNLAEISSPLFPGERLVVCRNPAVAAERARKRAELLAATEVELEKVKTSVQGPRGRLRGAAAGQIGERAGKVSNKYKVAKHFTLQIADGVFTYERKTDQINQEAALDGLYAIRTTLPADKLAAPAAVRAYKQLKMADGVELAEHRRAGKRLDRLAVAMLAEQHGARDDAVAVLHIVRSRRLVSGAGRGCVSIGSRRARFANLRPRGLALQPYRPLDRPSRARVQPRTVADSRLAPLGA